MIEGELIYVTVISTIGGLIGLLLIQRFWDHKWDKNYAFEKFKITERRKDKKIAAKIKNPEPKGLIGNLAQFLPILQTLDVDQIKALAAAFTGEGGEGEGEGEGIIGQIIKAIPPETITEFLKGAMAKVPEKQQNKGY